METETCSKCKRPLQAPVPPVGYQVHTALPRWFMQRPSVYWWTSEQLQALDAALVEGDELLFNYAQSIDVRHIDGTVRTWIKGKGWNKLA